MKNQAAESFEDLHVYQRARELVRDIYAIARDGEFARDRGFVDQVCRASVSIVANNAEGFERGSKTEFIQFLFIAKGSSGEVCALLGIARDLDYIDSTQFERLNDSVRRVSGMISNFIAHLQKTEYQGEKTARPRRHATEAQQERIERLIDAQRRNKIDPDG